MKSSFLIDFEDALNTFHICQNYQLPWRLTLLQTPKWAATGFSASALGCATSWSENGDETDPSASVLSSPMSMLPGMYALLMWSRD